MSRCLILALVAFYMPLQLSASPISRQEFAAQAIKRIMEFKSTSTWDGMFAVRWTPSLWIAPADILALVQDDQPCTAEARLYIERISKSVAARGGKFKLGIETFRKTNHKVGYLAVYHPGSTDYPSSFLLNDQGEIVYIRVGSQRCGIYPL